MNDEVIALQKTMHRFHTAANQLMQADYNDFEKCIKRLLLFIDQTPVIRSYIDECLKSRDLEDFDAKKEVSAVCANPNEVFETFSVDVNTECGEVYLILKELAGSNKYNNPNLICGYGEGSNKLNDMVKGFNKKVCFNLISAINEHLSLTGIEMGLGETSAQINNIYNQDNATAVMANDGSNVNVTQYTGINTDELGEILARISSHIDELDETEKQKAVDALDGIRKTLSEEKPQKKKVRKFIDILKGFNGGAQFISAIGALVKFLQASSIL